MLAVYDTARGAHLGNVGVNMNNARLTPVSAAEYNRVQVKVISYAQAHVSTEKTPKSPSTWIPVADEHPCRPVYPQTSHIQGAGAARRVMSAGQGVARRPIRKPCRLTRAKDFAAVRIEGRRRADRLMVLLARRNDLEVSRAGYSVGKRIGKAVVRNRVKRRMREAVGLAGVHEGWDLVLIARKGAASADFHSLSSSVTSLLKRAGIPTSSHRAPQQPLKTK